jgi:hypothetical protein
VNRQQFEDGLYKYSYRLVRENIAKLSTREAAKLKDDRDAERFAVEVERLLPQARDIDEAPQIVRRAARQAIHDHLELQ